LFLKFFFLAQPLSPPIPSPPSTPDFHPVSGEINMLIGIMSDAHDSIQGVKDALRIFSERGVDLTLFAGDMIGSGNCYTFEGLGISVRLVYGNNDVDRAGLASEFTRPGGNYPRRLSARDQVGTEQDPHLHGTEEPAIRECDGIRRGQKISSAALILIIFIS
jgi:hypothetical protein